MLSARPWYRAAERGDSIRRPAVAPQGLEFTIIESQRRGGAQVEERMELDINELLNFSPLMKTFTFNAWSSQASRRLPAAPRWTTTLIARRG